LRRKFSARLNGSKSSELKAVATGSEQNAAVTRATVQSERGSYAPTLNALISLKKSNNANAAADGFAHRGRESGVALPIHTTPKAAR
jgi:hypothetical protein